jgi:hypothetical protein
MDCSPVDHQPAPARGVLAAAGITPRRRSNIVSDWFPFAVDLAGSPGQAFQFFLIIAVSTIVVLWFVRSTQDPRLPVIICRRCKYKNRPRNRTCGWCGERLR